mgnify:CR=1 FL=1
MTYIYIAKISLFYVPIFWIVTFSMSIFNPYSLCTGPAQRADGEAQARPDRAMGRAIGPRASGPYGHLLPSTMVRQLILGSHYRQNMDQKFGKSG